MGGSAKACEHTRISKGRSAIKDLRGMFKHSTFFPFTGILFPVHFGCVKLFNLTTAGAACLFAGLAIWGTFTIQQRRQGEQTGNRLLSAFAPQEDRTEQQAAIEGQALVQLFQADQYARAAFLRAALRGSLDAQRLKGREQGFAVSLSRIESSEAQALVHQAILPAINGSREPGVLREGFALMARWSITGAMKTSENEKVASILVVAMLHSRDTDQIDALA